MRPARRSSACSTRTPVPRDDYWLGVPEAGTYRKILDTDAASYGGSGYAGVERVTADAHPVPRLSRTGCGSTLPPLAALFFRLER
ncbi:MAG: alpha amylase C-terminal domain-containing protein [Chromatiales bacterium]|nr:alpha amylase C-terminal domain-containing protein [Chromatiales bacterium]